MVVMNDGSFRAVVACQSINFDLMSDREREGVEYSYQSFLNSLSFPIQILIRSQRVDIGPYLDRLVKIRRDQDNMLLAIKARALMEPPTVDVPGATRGAKKSGGSSASDDEVARIVAALSSGGSTTASTSRPKAKAKPRPVAKKAASKRPAQGTPGEAQEEIAVDPSDVDAMIQFLLSAPVADESVYVADAETAPEPATATSSPRPSSAQSSAQKGAPMDMSEFEGKGGGATWAGAA